MAVTNAAAGNGKSSMMVLGDLFRRFSVFVILLGIGTIFAVGSERFLQVDNLLNIALQTSMIAIVAIGMTFTILTAGIDLSVGSVMALAGALAAGLAARQGMATPVAILLALAAGGGIGAINGLLIVRGGVPPFVATLAMLAVARGATLVYTQGRPIAGLDETFIWLGNGKVLGLPVPVLIMLILAWGCLFHPAPHPLWPARLRHRRQPRDHPAGRRLHRSGDADGLRDQRTLRGLGRYLAHRPALVGPTQRGHGLGAGRHRRARAGGHQPLRRRRRCGRHSRGRIHHRRPLQRAEPVGHLLVLPTSDQRHRLHFGRHAGSLHKAAKIG